MHVDCTSSHSLPAKVCLALIFVAGTILCMYIDGDPKKKWLKNATLDPFLTLWFVGVPWLQRGEYVDIARLAQRSALCVGQIALRCFSEILVKKILWVLKFSRSFLDGLVTWCKRGGP